jgi:hypothetical protein
MIETLVAAVILILGLAALFGLLDTSVKATASTRAREGATSLARQVLEDAHTIPYAQLSSASIAGELQTMNGLTDGSPAAGWQIIRRGVTYTVTVTECSVDDPKDAFGVHEGTFCGDAGEKEWKAGEAAKDAQAADLKRVTAEVKWVAQGRTPKVRQTLTLTAAGGAVGLTASNLRLTVPFESTAPVIASEPVSQKLTFAVSSPTGTTAVEWSLEGSRQSPGATLQTGTTWAFSWSIAGVSDGTYQVAAQAVNAEGVVGPPVTIPVTLIRNVPAAPKGFKGGFNTINVAGTPKQVTEFQWQANAERNVIGYRVYRPTAAGKELACPTSPETLSLSVSCIDLIPPKPTAANLTYEVVALYRKAEGQALSNTVSEGTPAQFKVAGGEPPPAGPNAPGAPLTLTHNADGSVTLNWSAPASGGAAVAFYRVYRGSTNYSDRYDVTLNGTTTTYTDTDATSSHSYWVTAVGSTLTESPFLGPVTG